MQKDGYIFYWISVCRTLLVYAQQTKTDSLLAVLSASKEDTSKVKSLIDLANALRKNSDSVPGCLALRPVTWQKKLIFPQGLALAYKNIGISYYSQGKNEIILENWNKSLEVYRSMKDSVGIANHVE